MNDRAREEHPVILFDGGCVLCNATARFARQRDRQARLRFAPLQSPAARRLLGRYGCRVPDQDSVVLVAGGHVYRRSRAVLEVLRRLDPPWPLLFGLVVVPRFLADAVYDFVGARRYRWFGATTCCAVGDADPVHLLDD
jgi:predicted DCC family thiol-disulfide oxidoreductase YuxK